MCLESVKLSKIDRCGKRKIREHNQKRFIKLGYYLIVTDTEETEKHYMYGLRDSLPEHIRKNLVIKVIKTKTTRLVETAIQQAALIPQFSDIWIIFDRDKVTNFNEIISEAKKNQIHVGWSNPCIEIWFFAYFGIMPSYSNSVQCCKEFGHCYELKVNQKYTKADTAIYRKLYEYGDEKTAIKIAEQKQKEHIKNGINTPSEMIPCTTVHELIHEIREKVNN